MGHLLSRFTLGTTLAAVLAISSPANTTLWLIDPQHTAAGFSVKHLMISTVRGQFKSVTGTVVWDDQDISKSTVDVTIDANTVDTSEPKRDADLKSANFFDVAHYPTITFKSKTIEQVSAGKMKITGDLTIHGSNERSGFKRGRTDRPGKRSLGKYSRGGKRNHQNQSPGFRNQVGQQNR